MAVAGTAAAQAVEVRVRDVTDDEVAYFWENGWARLPALIDPALAAELLARAKARMGERGDAHERRPGIDLLTAALWHDYHDIAREDGLYWALATHPTMGRNASRLLGRDMSIRLITETLGVKLPATWSKASAKTEWHQDAPNLPVERTTMVTWIALDEITPEMGSMRFYEGSHKLGSMGKADMDGRSAALPDVWPRIRQCPLSEPLQLAAGDATVHQSLVVHGAPQNTTDRARWTYVIAYYPGDARYNGLPNHALDGCGFAPLQVIDHPRFPVVYAPA
jgi:hypothetical protein